jgi:hypothetical protein
VPNDGLKSNRRPPTIPVYDQAGTLLDEIPRTDLAWVLADGLFELRTGTDGVEFLIPARDD